MPYSIQFRPKAVRQMRKLQPDALRRITPHIEALAKDPFPAGCKKLTNQDELYRIRVGDFRVVYQHDGENLIILVVLIGQRKEIYRMLSR